jgi:hypothetical protein
MMLRTWTKGTCRECKAPGCGVCSVCGACVLCDDHRGCLSAAAGVGPKNGSEGGGGVEVVEVEPYFLVTEYLLANADLGELVRTLGRTVLRQMMPRIEDGKTRARVRAFIDGRSEPE